jgi:CheY-like chemotaxis protein
MLGLFKTKQKLARPRILIVDDEPDFISTVQCQLRWCRYDVSGACDGAEGLKKAAAWKPNLILLDINMPRLSGHEVLKHLRADPKLKHIPVIMLTATCEPEDIAAVSAYGVADYVAKPFDFSELMRKIANALDSSRT